MSDSEWITELINDTDHATMSDKQRKILEAAIDTFSEKGYSGSSTSEIAKSRRC